MFRKIETESGLSLSAALYRLSAALIVLSNVVNHGQVVHGIQMVRAQPEGVPVLLFGVAVLAQVVVRNAHPIDDGRIVTVERESSLILDDRVLVELSCA